MSSTFDYSAFEDYFRGDPREILRKLSVYLPLVRQLPFDDSCPALDVGCGRGEWLLMLKDNGIPSEGVDINSSFVAACRKAGLKVQEQDLFAYLDQRPDQLYSLISGFHIIEHLNLDQQQAFLATAYERLVPGGILLLETPNPENSTVGACNFYIDPTHVRPVPALLLEFLARQAGFVITRIARLNFETLGIKVPITSFDGEHASYYSWLNELLFSRVFQAPDYALIAFKSPLPATGMLDAVDEIIRNEERSMFDEKAQVAFMEELRERDKKIGALEAQLAHQEQQLTTKDAKLSAFGEQLTQVRLQLEACEHELRSLYNNELGKLLKKYKRLKRSWKQRSKSMNQECSVDQESDKFSSSAEERDLSPAARKMYHRLTKKGKGAMSARNPR
jgi:O-antigen chain-terminating methyltransferase